MKINCLSLIIQIKAALTCSLEWSLFSCLESAGGNLKGLALGEPITSFLRCFKISNVQQEWFFLLEHFFGILSFHFSAFLFCWREKKGLLIFFPICFRLSRQKSDHVQWEPKMHRFFRVSEEKMGSWISLKVKNFGEKTKWMFLRTILLF